MSKSLLNQKQILKIESSRFRTENSKDKNWKIEEITREQAIKNDELIKLADSQVLRFIADITYKNGHNQLEEDINTEKNIINNILKEENNPENRKLIQKSVKKINELSFIKDYINIVMDTKSDYNVIGKHGVTIGDEKYYRIFGTTGGIKNSVITFASETVYDELEKKLNNGIDFSKIQVAPAKFTAYKSLQASSSTPVSHPKNPMFNTLYKKSTNPKYKQLGEVGVIVVPDCITGCTEKVTLIKDNIKQGFPDVFQDQEMKIEINASDGFGLGSPELMKQWSIDLKLDYISSGFCIRNSWTKGMVFGFDFHKFAEMIGSYEVTDIWGDVRDIREASLILTESMLKLWMGYVDWEDYWNNCTKHGYTYSVTKAIIETLENERNLNYQFIQSFDLSDEDIKELCDPTINEIQETLGDSYERALLFLNGKNMNEQTFDSIALPHIKALMVEPQLINDPYIQSHLLNMRKKRIKQAKTGVLKVDGCYIIISGDPYALCQSMFGLEVTGLLDAGEVYCKYWSDRGEDEILCFRAPMSCHENIRKPKVVATEDMEKWYSHMPNVLILNCHDTITHAMNGCDFDSDAFITTNNQVLKRNYKHLNTIICEQKKGESQKINLHNLITADKNGFGNGIGSVTNRITGMYDVLANFEEGTKEYMELQKRIQSGQHYQQCEIDKIKGIVSLPMPKTWYKKKDVYEIEDEELREFNLKILADKKPYFFIYIYPELKKEYDKYKKIINSRSIWLFKKNWNQLEATKNKTEEEQMFYNYCINEANPVSEANSTMNRICKYIESRFDDYTVKQKEIEFNSDILRTYSDNILSNSQMDKIKKIYSQYNKELASNIQKSNLVKKGKDEEFEDSQMLKQKFYEQCIQICNNKEILCDAFIQIIYKTNKSKKMVWDLFGDVLLNNLYNKNNQQINYVSKDEKGDIKFNGEQFILKTIKGDAL